jgi:hypothetical protein
MIKNIGYLISFPTISTENYDKYIDCAESLLENNYNTTNICILAGLTKPFNFFEIKKIILNVKNDLGIPEYKINKAAVFYSYHLIEEISNGIDVINNLKIVANLSISNEYLSEIFNFAELYWAYDDLLYSDNQYYWEGMNKSNYLDIIINVAKEWLSDNKKILETGVLFNNTAPNTSDNST